MVAVPPVFHGTQEETHALVNAIARNCGCQHGLMGVRTSTCAPHQMLLDDQRALNGLLFMRRRAEELQLQEWKEWSP